MIQLIISTSLPGPIPPPPPPLVHRVHQRVKRPLLHHRRGQMPPPRPRPRAEPSLRRGLKQRGRRRLLRRNVPNAVRHAARGVRRPRYGEELRPSQTGKEGGSYKADHASDWDDLSDEEVGEGDGPLELRLEVEDLVHEQGGAEGEAGGAEGRDVADLSVLGMGEGGLLFGGSCPFCPRRWGSP
jgi:hypothetical protein